MNCRVIILSDASGKAEKYSAGGELSGRAEGFSVRYNLDGDECILTASDKGATQKRTGGQNVFISFEKGRFTGCGISGGGFEGGFEIFTERYTFCKLKGGYKLSIGYKDGERKVNLTVKIIKTGK